jgi:hypothetical protein
VSTWARRRWTALAAARLARAVPRSPRPRPISAPIRALAAALGERPALALPGLPRTGHRRRLGHRASGRRAIRIARRAGGRLLLVEDGFLRSPGARTRRSRSSSTTSASTTTPRGPSRLERQIAEGRRPRPRPRLLQLWRSRGLSKIRASPLPDPAAAALRPRPRPARGRRCPSRAASPIPAASTGCCRPRGPSFPGLPVVLKTHPDTALRGRRSHFDPRACPASWPSRALPSRRRSSRAPRRSTPSPRRAGSRRCSTAARCAPSGCRSTPAGA